MHDLEGEAKTAPFTKTVKSAATTNSILTQKSHLALNRPPIDGTVLVSELERSATLPESSGPGWIFGGGPVSDKTVSQDLSGPNGG
jgi:hypothetical protein